MGALEPWHLAVIALIALFVFGPNKVADIGGTVGKAVRDFRDATEGKPAAAPPSAAAETHPCTRCQAPVAANARFCSQCGASTLPIVSREQN